MLRRWRMLALFVASLGVAATMWSGCAAAASITNCTWCHGTGAQGYAVAPRLAGQRAAYIEGQLRSYAAHIRDNPFSRQYMWGAAAHVNSDAARDLAVYFESLPAKSALDGQRGLVAQGETLYLQGNPEANIVACQACHGPAGQGVRDIPRLGGMSYFYLKRRLVDWQKGYHSTVGSPMPMVSGSLAPADIEALASYLSFIR